MQFLYFVASLLALTANATKPKLTDAVLAPLLGTPEPEFGNRFAVVFKREVSTTFVQQFLDQLGVNNSLVRPDCGTTLFMNGDIHLLKTVLFNSEVKYVEYVGRVKAFDNTCSLVKKNVTWGVARVSQRRFVDNSTYHCQPGAGKGVRVYIIGMNIKHTVFGGRARWGKHFVPYSADKDVSGHGTAVGGLTGLVTPGATLYAVKVLDRDDRGSLESFIRGICWVVDQAKKTKDKVVMNISLGGYYSRLQNDAVTTARKAGIGVVVSAGNNRRDACRNSPASSTDAFTVASSNIRDEFSTKFSNFGQCVNVIAPGEDLYVASSTNITGYRRDSGTSFASPIVAGILANILTIHNIERGADGYEMIKKLALKNVIRNKFYLRSSNTPNLLANNGCLWRILNL